MSGGAGTASTIMPGHPAIRKQYFDVELIKSMPGVHSLNAQLIVSLVRMPFFARDTL
jgi:hypothetical protein